MYNPGQMAFAASSAKRSKERQQACAEDEAARIKADAEAWDRRQQALLEAKVKSAFAQIKEGVLDLNRCELWRISDLAKLFATIPSNVKVLLLGGCDLADIRYKDKLVKGLAAIPAHVKEVHLNDNHLGARADNLSVIFAAIPSTVTGLSLKSNEFGRPQCLGLKQVLAAIPKSITHIALDKNELGKLCSADWLSFCSALPKHITELELDENSIEKKTRFDSDWERNIHFAQGFLRIPNVSISIERGGESCTLTGAEWAKYFSEMPEGKTKLEFDFRFASGAMTEADIAESFSMMSKRITTLKVRYFLEGRYNKQGRYNKSDMDFSRVLAAIPTHVTSLDLSNNDLVTHISCLSHIPKTVAHLNLGTNNFGSKPRIFLTLPVGVVSLDLSTNGFGKMSDADLEKFFSTLPRTITALNLGFNDLGEKAAPGLVGALTAIPVVEDLNLQSNGLGSKSGYELMQLLSVLPKGLKKLGLKANQLERRVDFNFACVFAENPEIVIEFDTGKRTGRELIRETVKTQLSNLVQRCLSFSSKEKNKIDAVYALKAHLEGLLSGAGSYDAILQHVNSELEKPNNPLLSAFLLRKSDVQKIFEHCREVMQSLQTRKLSSFLPVATQEVGLDTTREFIMA